MNIKLKSLVITNYDDYDKRKIRFVKDMKDDQLVGNYVTKSIDNILNKSINDNKIMIGSGYIVCDGRKLVGYVRPAELLDINTLELHYAVHPDYRRQGYGSKILVEVSDYLLKHIKDINNIKLYINSENRGSIKCAKKAGFLKCEEFPNRLVSYIKTR